MLMNVDVDGCDDDGEVVKIEEELEKYVCFGGFGGLEIDLSVVFSDFG